MQRVKYDESEILDAYFEVAGRSGMLERKAELLYPDFDISAPKPHEIEGIKVSASYDNRILTAADHTMADEAHPEGSVRLDVPGDKTLATVEDLADRAKVMREVAEKTPTGKVAAEAIGKLVAVADLLDTNGLSAFAKGIDAIINKLAADQPYLDDQLEADADKLRMAQDTAEFPKKEEQAKAERHAEIAKNNNKAIGLLNQLIRAQVKDPAELELTRDLPQNGVWEPRYTEFLKRDFGINKWNTWPELFGQMEAKLAQLATGAELKKDKESRDSLTPVLTQPLSVKKV